MGGGSEGVLSGSAARGIALAALLAACFATLAAAAPAARAASLSDAARTLVGAGQGVHVEAEDGSVLVSQAADRAVHPASISKLPTTLALLRTLGAEHRFATRLHARGVLANGVLEGDLVVDAAGDPFFVDENALLVLLRLREVGLRSVSGDLRLRGSLLFDWQEAGAAARLRGVLEGKAPAAAWRAVQGATRAPAGAPPGLVFRRGAAASGAAETLLLTHRSEPLVPLLKALNGYSNNVFAWLAGAAGGIAKVEALARASVPAPLRAEIVLGDGAGLDRRNRLSPRAAVALLRALHQEVTLAGVGLAELLPVAGVDPGTLLHRLDRPGERGSVVAKTGTYGDYGACALAGALRTRTRGVVYFAILNHRVPIAEARRRQDAFVRALLAELGAEPWPYLRDPAPAFTRAEIQTAALRERSTPR
jgi:D-alanyl-D-alanine carboxypeptidase/D-alanyl-D-alanine-endopeptidase (penicillin-binding protein 4)